MCLPRWQCAAHSATPASYCSRASSRRSRRLLVLSPILVDVAREFGVSTATAGQLRSISGATGGVTALVLATAARRPGLRELLSLGAALVAARLRTQRRGAIASPCWRPRRPSSASASACSSRSASQPRANGRHRAAARTCSHGRSPACRRPGSSGCRWSARSRTYGWRAAWLAVPAVAGLVALALVRLRPGDARLAAQRWLRRAVETTRRRALRRRRAAGQRRLGERAHLLGSAPAGELLDLAGRRRARPRPGGSGDAARNLHSRAAAPRTPRPDCSRHSRPSRAPPCWPSAQCAPASA